MGKKKRGGQRESQGVLVDLLTSMVDGSVPPALITSVYVCLTLSLFIGITGLFLAGASYYYYAGLILIIVGFFVSFSWYISQADLGKPKKKKSS